MSVLIFPCKNQFFKHAIMSLLDEGFVLRKKREKLLIVCLASWSLKEVLFASWIKYWNVTKILIVCEERYLPLANYLQLRNKNSIKICNTLDFYNIFRYYLCCGELCKLSHSHCFIHLTDMEYVSLQRALDGESVQWQAQRMGISCKTVFSHRATAAKKFGLKKISHIISSKIKNEHCKQVI